jgi:hypothetical protein
VHIERPYQYKINRKKRAVTEREGLDNDEEEVEDLMLWGILRKSCAPHMREKLVVKGLKRRSLSILDQN